MFSFLCQRFKLLFPCTRFLPCCGHVVAYFRFMSCPCSPPSCVLHACPSTLHVLFKFSRKGFIQASPILFMPIAFYCRGYFCPRHLTRALAGIITPVLAESDFCPGLPTSQRRVWWKHRELTSYSGCCPTGTRSVTVSCASFQQPGSSISALFSDMDFI